MINLVSIDRRGIETTNEVVILRFFLVVDDHRLYLRKHALPLAVALIFLLALLHDRHTDIVGHVGSLQCVFLVAQVKCCLQSIIADVPAP